MATETTVFLAEFETKALLDLASRGPGTYYIKLMINCNSLLSSVYIRASDPGTTIKANYFDTTTGSEFTSERYDLESHPILTDANAGETHRILVTRIHNKPQLELIITGGNVEFGVYGTAVSSSASDIDNALVRDGDTFVPEDTKGLPIACYDDVAGEMRFLRCPIPVEITGGRTPVSKTLALTLANTEYSYALPANTIRWKVKNTGSDDVEMAFSAFSGAPDTWPLYPSEYDGETNINPAAAITLYFRSTSAGQEVRIRTWS